MVHGCVTLINQISPIICFQQNLNEYILVQRRALTRGVGAAPTLGQAQRVAAPSRGGLVVGEAWRRPGRGRGTARPLRDFP